MKHYRWHRFIFSVLRYTAGPVIKLVMGYSCKKKKAPDAPLLVISNHNTDLDPAFVALGFSGHMYFVASEHSLRMGFASKLLKFVFSPIAINKTREDVSAIKEILRRLKSGASVCLFGEGDRSFSGATGPVTLAAAKLARTSGAELATFRIEGGYFTSPRWSKKNRKGKMTGSVVNRYSAAELKAMTNEQLLEAIERDIFEDAYQRQRVQPTLYKGKDLAENIETTLYLCPGCNEIGTIRSEGDGFGCGCGLAGTYTEAGTLEGVTPEGDTLPFSTMLDWDRWQVKKLEEIIDAAGDGPICADEDQQLFEVSAAVAKTSAGEGAMSIDRRAFHCAGSSFPLGDIIRIVVVGQMTLLFALKGGATYEVRSAVPRSALKYREIFRILTKGTVHGAPRLNSDSLEKSRSRPQ